MSETAKQDEIITRVKELMVDKGSRSVLSFAKCVGIDCSNLSKKLKGLSNFTERDLILISRSLHVNLMWLTFGKGDKYCSSHHSYVSDMITDENVKLRIEKARLEERVQCLESEKVFLQQMLSKQ